jgi:hypothetical protein
MRRVILFLSFATVVILFLFSFSAPLTPSASAQCVGAGCIDRRRPDPPGPERPEKPVNVDERNPVTGSGNPTGLGSPIASPVASPVNILVVPVGTPEPITSPEPPARPSPAATLPPVAIVTQVPAIPISFYPTSVKLNEYRAQADSADNEWIELYNTSDGSVDLSGWQLAHTANGGGAFIIPDGTVIAGDGYLVFTRAQTGLMLDPQLDDVQLVQPNRSIADTEHHIALKAEQINARSVDGAGIWVLDCKATPNTTNCPAIVAVATPAPNYYRDHIATPSILGNLNVAALVTNFLLALILALAMGFFGNLLNDVLESNEPQIAAWFAPLRPVINGMRNTTNAFDAVFEKWGLAALGWIIKLTFMLVLYGLVFAYLDPSFDITSVNGWLLVAALALSAGLVGIIDDIAQYIYLRANGLKGTIRLHGGNLTLSIVSALFSRISGVTPGLLFGNPAGLEDVDDPRFEMPSHFIAMGAMGAVAILGWLLSSLFDTETWFHTTLLLVFALGVQSVFFEMLPLKYMHGKGIFQYNRWLWIGLFAIITTIFFQTMLNPDGDFVRAFQQTNMVILALIVIVFCFISSGLWFYFQQREKAQVQG